ncbi:MAG: hypothetical protein A3C35_03150 [Omnitrophica bacterium RIFCSPHIGHO2_02_FULL_46_11]|nr:MAG: hypothetical protein A3A81_06385 [Omnitrophica bacterium RIFCSPLOWO2_01_FULL_45_10b]OGW87952.1 MAG: hypothetical protein A3C35_03150 [Omnitrophica bacterium RIFCSPHIGHO2_02_FULL_46_11]
MVLEIFIITAYGIFNLVGGVIGYVKAKSAASLIAGSVSGLIFLASAYGVSQGIRAAYLISLLVALLLGIRFSKTWFKTRRLMPDLIMILFSLVTLIVVGPKAF